MGQMSNTSLAWNKWMFSFYVTILAPPSSYYLPCFHCRCTQLSAQVFRSVANCQSLTSLNLRALPLTDDALAIVSFDYSQPFYLFLDIRPFIKQVTFLINAIMSIIIITVNI